MREGLQRTDYRYELPPELIAQTPLSERAGSRLLTLDGATGRFADGHFADLPALLRPGDVLVFNDTRVLPARLRGHKDTGGAVELLLERLLPAGEGLFMARASKPLRPGTEIRLEGLGSARVVGKEGAFWRLAAPEGRDWAEVLEQAGEMPLPPYIQRAAGAEDLERYQTVFARVPGAVAAPTAGLHFDGAMLAELDRLGVERAFVTLHVGAGTFQPVRADDIRSHVMHSEWLEVPEATAAKIAAARARGGRIVAVGTTALRALESAAASGDLRPMRGETRLFIYPGYRFRAVDLLLTNFHLPESTLLMLVAAFAGRETVLAAYCHAVAARYRFFSYGDAMFIYPSREAR